MSRTVSSSLCAIVTIHSSQRNLSLFCPHRLAEMMSRSSTPSFSYEEKELKLLKSAIQFFFRHIRFDESTVSRMSDNPVFQLFDERRYHYSKVVDSVLTESVYETTETHIATFILTILHQGLFSVTSFIVAIIYLSRFKEVTRVSLHTYTWRLLFLTALLVADKASEDKPIKNGSLVKLFPVITASELNELELALLLKIKFSIFVKGELFNAFLEKLMNEKVSVEIHSIVNSSDYVSQQLAPALRTLPCTPEPTVLQSLNKTPRRSEIFEAPSSTRSRSQQPHMYVQTLLDNSFNTTPRKLVSQTVAPVVIEQSRGRGRSPSVQRRNSSFMDDNSLEYSRTSSRRHSVGRPAHVPPPPIFEPARFHGHPRRLSLGRVVRDPAPDRTQQAFGRNVSPRPETFMKIPSQRTLQPQQRWNNLF